MLHKKIALNVQFHDKNITCLNCEMKNEAKLRLPHFNLKLLLKRNKMQKKAFLFHTKRSKKRKKCSANGSLAE